MLRPQKGGSLPRRRSSLSQGDPNGTFPDLHGAIPSAASTPRGVALQGGGLHHGDVEHTFASPPLSPVHVPPSASKEHDGLGSSPASGQRQRSAGPLTPQDAVFYPAASAEDQNQTPRSAAVQPPRRQEPSSPPSEEEDEAVVTSPLSHHNADMSTVAASVGSGQHGSSNGGSFNNDDLEMPVGVRLMELAEGRRRKKPLGPAPVPFGQSTRQLLALRQSLR